MSSLGAVHQEEDVQEVTPLEAHAGMILNISCQGQQLFYWGLRISFKHLIILNLENTGASLLEINSIHLSFHVWP